MSVLSIIVRIKEENLLYVEMLFVSFHLLLYIAVMSVDLFFRKQCFAVIAK